jgi:hypothetical protein
MRAWVLVLATVTVVSGCAREAPVADPEVPRFSTAAPSGAGASGRPVPKTCTDVITPEDAGTILGVFLGGEPQPVVGVPLPDIGRTARLDCYYGLQPGRPLSTATLWVGVTSYTDARHAQDRLATTIDVERDASSHVDEIPVGQGKGTLLRGKAWTVVALRGSTTVVVTVRPNLVNEDRAGPMLGQLADRVLTPQSGG